MSFDYIGSLPRQVNIDDPRAVGEAVRDIVSYLNNIPRFELRQIEAGTDADGYLMVRSTFRKVQAVLLGQCHQTDDVDATVSFSALEDWRWHEDGIKVRVDTSGVKHTFTFLLVGE